MHRLEPGSQSVDAALPEVTELDRSADRAAQLSVERFDVLMKGFPLWEKQDKSLGLCLLW